MSKSIQPIRKYKMSDADLKQLADNILQLIDRDSAEFSDWGFSPSKQQEFTNQINAFISIRSDETLEGRQITATENKNAAREILETQMRFISLKAKLTFGANSGKFKEFGESGISTLSDNDIIRTARTVEYAADTYLSELSNVGLSVAKIQELKAAISNLDAAIDAQRKAITERDTSTHERVEAGNSLYELINRYAEIGKTIWYSTNESKYNDYIIYRSSSSSTPTDNGNPAPTPPEELKN